MKVSRQHLHAAATATYERTADQLKANCDSAACAAVCRELTGAIEAKFEAVTNAGAAVACARGCTFCCHQRVGVFPHEAIALLRHLRTTSSPHAATIERRILDNAQQIDGLTAKEHFAANIQCAFLVDGSCSVYEARPSACAAYHSMSRDRCQYSYEHPNDIGTPKNGRPALLELQAFGDALIEATKSGLEAAGLAANKGELHQTLRTLIEQPSVVERWSAGGDLAAAVPLQRHERGMLQWPSELPSEEREAHDDA